MSMLLMAVLLALAVPSQPEWTEVDRVIAQVGEEVITASEIRAESAIALLREGGPEFARSSSSAGLNRAALTKLVVRSLLVSEAKRLKLRPPSDEHVDEAVTLLAQRFANAGDFARFLERYGLASPTRPASEESESLPTFAPNWKEVGSSALRSVLAAELWAERFIELRVVTPRSTKARAAEALKSLVLRLAERTEIRFVPDESIDLQRALEASP